MDNKKTCFYVHEKYQTSCEKRDCKMWINCGKHKNCTIIAAKNGPMTLQDIGDIFNVTRMRICQLEKKIVSKLNNITKRHNISKDNIV